MNSVLCGDNAELFLNYEKVDTAVTAEESSNNNTADTAAVTDADEAMQGHDEINNNESTTTTTATSSNAAERAGPVATLIVNCAATLPLQTNAYVTLTADIELQAPDSHTGFAGRCIEFACIMLLRDLEAIVLQKEVNAATFLRAKLVLRYLCLCAIVGLLNWDQFTQWIQEWTQLAHTAYTNGHRHTFVSLAYLLVSTVPFLAGSGSAHTTTKDQHFDAEACVLSVLRPGLQNENCTAFRPGVGLRAVYLKSEQADDAGEDDEDDDEESDEEDEDGVLPVCDTLGEVVKATEALLSGGMESSKFALLNEFPWQQKQQKQQTMEEEEKEPWQFVTVYDLPAVMNMTSSSSSNSDDGGMVDDDDDTADASSNCSQLAAMLSQPVSGPSDGSSSTATSPCIIYASMPLFDEDTNAHTKTLYSRLQPMDMVLIQQTIRDILTAFMVVVDKNGVCVGNVKLAAEQVYSIFKLIRCDDPAGDDVSSGSGLEYLLIETLMSIVLQCSGSRLYVYRIVLELCKLQPDTLPQALAIGVGTLVSELTNLVPRARHALSSWFAFHLTNTEYQWPFWSHWNGFVGLANDNDSKKVFLKGVMDGMASYARGDIIKEIALPEGSPLAQLVDDVGVGFTSDLL